MRRHTGDGLLTAPVRVQAKTLGSSSVRVTWNGGPEAAGVAGYKVFRDGTAVGTTVLPSHTDFGLAPEKRYAYTVAALDLAGNPSPMSAPPARVTTPARAPFCQVDLGAEDQGERLKQVTDPDGDTRPAKAGGRDCREPATLQDHYFYFAIDDGYLFNEAGLTSRLAVTYFDEAGFIEPQFDSVAGAYTSAKRIDLTGTGDGEQLHGVSALANSPTARTPAPTSGFCRTESGQGCQRQASPLAEHGRLWRPPPFSGSSSIVASPFLRRQERLSLD